MAPSVARIWAVVPLALLLIASGSAAPTETGSAALPANCQAANSFAAFDEAAQRFAFPARWICSVLTIESAGDVHARSPKGAMDLMQIMPATWGDFRERYHLGSDPYDPDDNILAGAVYLRELLDRYGSPGMFAAYNAGPSHYGEISRAALCHPRRERMWQSLQICLASNCQRRGPPAGSYRQRQRCSSRDPI